MPVSQVAAALRKLQSSQNIGKIVITIDRDATVLAEATSGLQPSSPSDEIFSADGTYVISGGTGSIGRGLAKWMVENGARNVVLLGRSATTNADVTKLVSQYSSSDKGVRMRAIQCDVGSAQSLEQALTALSDLPRVRGVIHAAMALSVRHPVTSAASDLLHANENSLGRNVHQFHSSGLEDDHCSNAPRRVGFARHATERPRLLRVTSLSRRTAWKCGAVNLCRYIGKEPQEFSSQSIALSNSTLTRNAILDVFERILSIPQQNGASGGYDWLASRSRHWIRCGSADQ